jgi:hypothetical protein
MASRVDIERGGGRKPRGGGANSGSFDYGHVSVGESEWTSWVVPMFVIANVAMFIVAMYVNNCPANPNPYGLCVARFLRRLSFQPLRQNPLLGPSSFTYDFFFSFFRLHLL